MNKKRRHWTPQEKLQILKEAEVYGMTQTLRKHGIYSSMFYRWKEKYEMEGEAGLTNNRSTVDPRWHYVGSLCVFQK